MAEQKPRPSSASATSETAAGLNSVSGVFTAAKSKPHTLAVQVRVWHSVSVPGQLAAVAQPIEPPVPPMPVDVIAPPPAPVAAPPVPVAPPLWPPVPLSPRVGCHPDVK